MDTTATVATSETTPPVPPTPPIVQNCPISFDFAPNGTDCIIPCPEYRGFAMTISSGSSGYSCTYSKDPSISFKLKTTPRYQSTEAPAPWSTLPNHDVYLQAIYDYNRNYAIAEGKVNRQEQVSTAFQKLQDAENVRDQSPDAYETARIAYYTLTKGDSWINDEKQRIANTEAQPIVDKYLNSFNDLLQRTDNQQQTIDAVNGVKNNLLSVTDDMRFSVNAFEKQVSEIKNEIEINKKKKTVVTSVVTSWFDFIMNILILAVTGVAIFFVGRAIARRVTPSVPITPATT